MVNAISDYFAAMQSSDLKRIEGLLSPRVSLKDPFRGWIIGLPAAVAFYRELLLHLSGSQIKLEKCLSDGPEFIASFTLSLPHSKDVIQGVDKISLDQDGKILKVVGFLDSLPPLPFLAEGKNDRGDDLPPGLFLSHMESSKTVIKNWGYEKWLVHEQAPFALKVIHLKAGTRTSLQYHTHKEEANFVLSGTGHLHYLGKTTDQPKTLKLEPGHLIYIRPPAVHRIEALSDLYLVEVSTPELDDVVRLLDDWGRPNGRIESEHRL